MFKDERFEDNTVISSENDELADDDIDNNPPMTTEVGEPQSSVQNVDLQQQINSLSQFVASKQAAHQEQIAAHQEQIAAHQEQIVAQQVAHREQIAAQQAAHQEQLATQQDQISDLRQELDSYKAASSKRTFVG